MTLLARFAASLFVLFLVPATGRSQAFQTESIIDTALNMKAYDVLIPKGWKYQGTLMQGDSCSQLASPVWRAYSPDGLSEFRRLPRFDWSWSNAPYAANPQGDCLPLTRDVSAGDFVRHMGEMLQLKYIGEVKEQGYISAFMQAIENDNAGIMAAAGQRPFRGSATAARFEDQNGSFVMEEQITVGVRCAHYDLPALGQGRLFRETCGAEARIVRAPKGKLDALVESIDAHGGYRENALWSKAVVSVMQQQMFDNAEQSRRIMAARNAQFQHDQGLRAQQNQQFQAATQAGYARQNAQRADIQGSYDRHNANETQNMEARHTPASDWVDYALDQQTVTGSAGVAVKVSGAYSQTWADGQGQYYQTNNPNTNPNGALPGNWTLQNPVHGNGRPQ